MEVCGEKKQKLSPKKLSRCPRAATQCVRSWKRTRLGQKTGTDDKSVGSKQSRQYSPSKRIGLCAHTIGGRGGRHKEWSVGCLDCGSLEKSEVEKNMCEGSGGHGHHGLRWVFVGLFLS